MIIRGVVDIFLITAAKAWWLHGHQRTLHVIWCRMRDAALGQSGCVYVVRAYAWLLHIQLPTASCRQQLGVLWQLTFGLSDF